MPSCSATDGESGGHDLVENEHAAVLSGRGAKHGEEVGVARNTATRTLHRLDEHGSDLVAVLVHRRLESCPIVVGKDQPVVRHIDRVRA